MSTTVIQELTSYMKVYNLPEFWYRRQYIGRFAAMIVTYDVRLKAEQSLRHTVNRHTTLKQMSVISESWENRVIVASQNSAK